MYVWTLPATTICCILVYHSGLSLKMHVGRCTLPLRHYYSWLQLFYRKHKSDIWMVNHSNIPQKKTSPSWLAVHWVVNDRHLWQHQSVSGTWKWAICACVITAIMVKDEALKKACGQGWETYMQQIVAKNWIQYIVHLGHVVHACAHTSVNRNVDPKAVQQWGPWV